MCFVICRRFVVPFLTASCALALFAQPATLPAPQAGGRLSDAASRYFAAEIALACEPLTNAVERDQCGAAVKREVLQASRSCPSRDTLTRQQCVIASQLANLTEHTDPRVAANAKALYYAIADFDPTP